MLLKWNKAVGILYTGSEATFHPLWNFLDTRPDLGESEIPNVMKSMALYDPLPPPYFLGSNIQENFNMI